MISFNRHPLPKASIGLALLLVVAQACSDSNDNPTPPDVTSGGENGTTAGTAGKNSSTSGGKSSSTGGTTSTLEGGNATEAGNSAVVGGDSSGGTGQGAGGEGGANSPPIPACTLPELGTDGCFNCPKDGKADQWLNRCADGDCEPFPNKTRLPLLNADGSVPALPN